METHGADQCPNRLAPSSSASEAEIPVPRAGRKPNVGLIASAHSGPTTTAVTKAAIIPPPRSAA